MMTRQVRKWVIKYFKFKFILNFKCTAFGLKGPFLISKITTKIHQTCSKISMFINSSIMSLQLDRRIKKGIENSKQTS